MKHIEARAAASRHRQNAAIPLVGRKERGGLPERRYERERSSSPAIKRVFFTSLTLTFLCTIHATASPFYSYSIIAKSGDTLDGFPVQSFKRAVSLNDNGHVALIAEGAGGRKAVFVAVPGGGGYVLHKLAETTSGDYGSVWVNNRNEVAASFSAVSRGTTSANVRRYSPDASSRAYLATTIESESV